MAQYLQGLLAERQGRLGQMAATAAEEHGLSPNLADRRFDPPLDLSPRWYPARQPPPWRGNTVGLPEMPAAIQAGLGIGSEGTYWGEPGLRPILEGAGYEQVSPVNRPPPHMMPLVMKGLEALRGMPGPAPTGQPYPSAPHPYAGTSILSQRLDPTTVMLSNQPPVVTPPAYPTPAAETFATQQPGPTLRQVAPPTDPTYQQAIEADSPYGTPAEARAGYHRLSRLLRTTVGRGIPDPESMGILDDLIKGNWITVTQNDYDFDKAAGRFPGGQRGLDRLTYLVDYWRSEFNRQMSQAAPSAPQWETQQGTYQNPPSGVPMPTP